MRETLRTTCTQDCPDACGLVAEVSDGRVERLRGDPHHPITRGFLCYRVGTHYLSRLYSPERLMSPMVRRGERFEPIAWDAALDLAAERLAAIRDESGGAAILHSQGGGSLGLLKALNGRFARLLGATATRGEVCDGAGDFANLADFGAADANDLEDVRHAKGVILWGRNVTASSPHGAALLNDVRRAGVPAWLIDPLPTRSRSLADRHIQPRPGGDAALALGAARVAFERGLVDAAGARGYTEHLDAYRGLVHSRSVGEWEDEAGVEHGTAGDLARFLGDLAPVTTWIGWGIQRRRNGATQLRAIDALCVVTGNIGVAGAGVSFKTQRKQAFDMPDDVGDAPRSVLLPRLGQDIEAADDPPIRAVLIDNHNPVATNPDSRTTARALRSREFVMVIDPFLTDTARCADLVLPCAMMLEQDDLVGSYGHHHVSASRAVARRVGGVRSDLEIYQALADRLGFGERLAGSAHDWMERMTKRLRESHAVSVDALCDAAVRSPVAERVAFEGRRFPTPTGRARLLTDYVAPASPDHEFPLHLLALSTGRWQASQLTNRQEDAEGPLVVTVHPDAASGIEDGGAALLQSRHGELRVIVRHDAAYRRDTVYAPRARSFERGLCVNQIIAPHLTDHGESAAYYDETVRLVAVRSPA